MQVSQNLENFIKDNKDLILSVEQDPDKANKLMSKLEDATGLYGIDFYYEALNCFKQLYGVNEFISYIDTFPVGFYRRGTFSTIAIPKNIKTIGANYLSGCINLKTVKFLQNSELTSLGNQAFAADNSLSKIYLPDKLQNIGIGAFQDCTELQKIVLPASVSTIQEYAFDNCVNLQSLKLNHTKITELSDSVFAYCSNLKRVFLPKTLTSISSQAFWKCNSLEKIIYMGTIEDWNKITISTGNTYLNNVPIQCIDGIIYTNLK